MQNTQQTIYAEVVASAIASYAEAITHAAHDSVAENNDYGILDNCDKIQYLLAESANYTTVDSLAVAALNSTLDTVVRECMYTMLHYYADTIASMQTA
jgi:hypothetical protein